MKANIRIVLVETSHPGNIGSAARAMKTMGLSQLYLVNPRTFPSPEATALAAGADDLLQTAHVISNLRQALQGCSLAIAVSARDRRLDWPKLTPRTCAEKSIQTAQYEHVALVFGNEQSGLTNEQLQICHCQVQISCNPAYSSLNLAAAVQILCYEIHVASMTTTDSSLKITAMDPLATIDELAGYYKHLEQILTRIHFLDPEKPGQLMSRVQRLYNRASVTKIELNILRGMLTSIEKIIS